MSKKLEQVVTDGALFSLDNSQTQSVYMEKATKDGTVYGTLGDYRIAIRSNVGVARENNEDNFGIYVPEEVVVVADGMGGHKGGAEAADFLVRAVTRPVKKNLFGRAKENYDLTERILEGDKAIREYTEEQKITSEKPGAAVGAVRLKNGILTPSYLGDVRVYVFDEEGRLRYMTADDSGTQAALFQGRIKDEDEELIIDGDKINHNSITNAVGAGSNPQVRNFFIKINPETNLTVRGRFKMIQEGIKLTDITPQVQLQPGWSWMVASDGLHEYVKHTDIEDIVREERNPNSIVNTLVNLANSQGFDGRDNITIAFGRYEPTSSQDQSTRDTKEHSIQRDITTTQLPLVGREVQEEGITYNPGNS